MTSATAARPESLRVNNQVLLALAVVAALAVALCGFVTLAPNRLVSGKPVALWQAAPSSGPVIIALVLALAGLALAPPIRALHRFAAMLAAMLIVVALYAAGGAAQRLGAGMSALARVSLGAGFWVVIAAAALIVVDGLQRAAAGPLERVAFALAIVAALAGLAASGALDALSLVHEYNNRQGGFSAAVIRHIELVAGSVLPAIAVGVPLGLLSIRRERSRGPIFVTLNLLQTIPSIALFGLLIAPLAALGLGGVGPLPALIALTLYALLPVARSTAAGLGGIDATIADAARGMGMTGRQILWRVEVPLAAPVLLAGLRIVVVQAIGLTVVAALIGAGGLGSFVFEGLGQDAADLVLLGALPAILLALAADFLLQLLAASVRR
ncbi:MAG TPA: ABC transporter permease [Stellaceae bacterium]